MDLVIFIEKGLFVFAEALWAAYLIFAVVFYFAKFVPGRLALKRFQRLRKLHRRIFLPVLCLFVFYDPLRFSERRFDTMFAVGFFAVAREFRTAETGTGERTCRIGRKNGQAGDICRR